MDNEMIERCAIAAWEFSASPDAISDFSLPLSDAKSIAIAVIKAMSEPTEKMKLAGTQSMQDYDDSLTCWYNMIDAIIGDK